MESNLIWCNMAVSNIERTTHFYTAIGFKPNGSHSQTLTSFVVGTNRLIMHFFTKEHLAEGMKDPLAKLQAGNEVIFTISAGSKEEVDNQTFSLGYYCNKALFSSSFL